MCIDTEMHFLFSFELPDLALECLVLEPEFDEGHGVVGKFELVRPEALVLVLELVDRGLVLLDLFLQSLNVAEREVLIVLLLLARVDVQKLVLDGAVVAGDPLYHLLAEIVARQPEFLLRLRLAILLL